MEVWTYDKLKNDLRYRNRIFLFLLLILFLNIACRKDWVHSEWVSFFFWTESYDFETALYAL
jgi:hypothetical protein